MSSITTRVTSGGGATVKNAPLTNTEIDNNFINLNVNKAELASAQTFTAEQTFNSGISFTGYDTVQYSPALNGFRNKIINGKMDISQRGTTFTINNATTGVYTLDRFKFYSTSGGAVLTVSQGHRFDGYAPPQPNLQKSLSIESITTAKNTLLATDYYIFEYNIEGYDILDFIDKTFTLSFWVRGSLPGTYTIVISNPTSTAQYFATYTISGTGWQRKTITVVNGLPSSFFYSSPPLETELGARIIFSLGAGTNYTSGVSPNTWLNGYSAKYALTGQTNLLYAQGPDIHFTGLQIEPGITASDFEFRPYQVELALCQRYYEIGIARSDHYAIAGDNHISTVFFKVPKRVVPTLTNTFAGSNSSVYYQQQPNIYGFEFGARSTSTGKSNCSGGWTASSDF